MKRATTLAGVPGFGGPAHPRCFSRLFVVPPPLQNRLLACGGAAGPTVILPCVHSGFIRRLPLAGRKKTLFADRVSRA